MINLKTKQINKFLISSALLATLASSSSAVAAPKLDGKVFGDWKISCTKDEKTKKSTCVAQQVLSTKQEDKNLAVATYQFFYDKKDLRMVQTLPQGILLQPGTSIVADKKLVSKGAFTICANNTCLAAANVSADERRKIVGAKELSLAMFNAQGKQFNLVISNKGLKKALDAMKDVK